MSATPADWYPNPEDSTQLRYWDGQRWTEHTAPAPQSAPVFNPAATMPLPPSMPTYAPPAPVAGQSANQPSSPSDSKKKWIVGGSIVAGVLVVGSIGAAIGGGDRGAEAAPAPVPTVTVTAEAPVPEETPVAAAELPPAPVAVDAVAFRAQSNSHLDDMNKDLDDIVTTVDEAGFWRLFSNSIELSFNLGQLQALEVPASLATAWPESLVALTLSDTALSEAIKTEDGPTIIAAVDAMRAQVEVTRTLANTAQ